MAEKDVIYDETENSESSENLSHEEWTIIGYNFSDKDDTDDGNNSAEDGINEDQNTSKSMEVISAPNNNYATDNETGLVIIEKHDEDSDGISVITESEAEQLVANKESRGNNDCGNHVFGALKVYEKTGEKTAPQVGKILNVVIACSLAAIIGLGAGRILGMDDKCPVSNSLDFSSIKIESDNLIDRIKELNEVKDVLDEIKASIPHVKRAHEKKSKRYERSGEKSGKISDTYTFDPDTTILDQLQTSLNTLCSVIDGMNPENDFIKSDTLRTQGVVADLIEFKKIIYTVVKEFEDTARPKEIDFLRHAEKRIRDVCESLLSDLSYTVHGLTMKIHHKLNKVRHKLNRRLCLLKKSEPMDGRVFKSLEENNSFLESCDKILNVTFKPSSQAVKTDKQEETNKKTYAKRAKKLKKNLIKQSAVGSEDDNYLGDSSSDSSMPDLTYIPRNDDFRKKKEYLRQGEKGAKQKCGKFLLENDLKWRKGRNTKSTKSSRGQSLRKLMMGVLVPEQICPLTKKHWLESESSYPKIQRLGVRVLNRKPLYSTILKSDIHVTSSAKNNVDQKNPNEEETLENAIERTDEELKFGVGKKGQKDFKETKHNVTPAESGINVQTTKSMKEQWNTNIREPIGVKKVEENLQAKRITVLKQEDSEQLEIPSVAGALTHCRRGRKCSLNDSAASFRDENNKYRKSSNEKRVEKRPEKTRDDDRKKTKKGKNERKIPIPKKFTDTKNERSFKERGDKLKINHQFKGDWQLQRSRAREMHRDRDHRSEWFFDRADFRQDARKNMDDKKRSSNSGAGRFSRYQPCKSYLREKCEPIFEERIKDEEFEDDYNWQQSKDMNDRKHSNRRAGFTAKKMIKMPHRKNIMQTKRH